MRDIKKEILESLQKIEKTEQVKILYAVESGSRCWGVESPDSDYDVRFVYVRKKKDYLQLQDRKDVIEWQLDDVLDVNGWDLDKTLKQFHKGNATLFEWANSSVVYKMTDEWKEIYAQAKAYFSVKMALHHYCGTAKSTYMKYLQEEQVHYKKYIYALRPLLACTYIEKVHQIPPVLFDDLMKECLPGNLKPSVVEMLKIKAETDEKALNPQIPKIRDYIQQQIVYYDSVLAGMEDDRNAAWDSLNSIFLQTLQKLK